MLKINYAQWNQTPHDLRQHALTSEHPRTRERYRVLYEIASGKSANQVSKEIKHRPDTVMEGYWESIKIPLLAHLKKECDFVQVNPMFEENKGGQDVSFCCEEAELDEQRSFFEKKSNQCWIGSLQQIPYSPMYLDNEKITRLNSFKSCLA